MVVQPMMILIWEDKWKKNLNRKVENGMENQGFPPICIEIDGMKYLEKKNRMS